MSDSVEQRAWHVDAHVLGEIGQVLAHVALPTVAVRLPRPLAELAAAAWQRDDRDAFDAESCEQRLDRHRAGTLALIGLAAAERGRWDGDELVVDLHADLVALAVDAADDIHA